MVVDKVEVRVAVVMWEQAKRNADRYMSETPNLVIGELIEAGNALAAIVTREPVEIAECIRVLRELQEKFGVDKGIIMFMTGMSSDEVDGG